MVHKRSALLATGSAILALAVALTPDATAKVDSSLPDHEQGVVDTQDPDTRCPGCLKIVEHFQPPASGQVDTCNTGGGQNPYSPWQCPNGLVTYNPPSQEAVAGCQFESVLPISISYLESEFSNGCTSDPNQQCEDYAFNMEEAPGLVGGRGCSRKPTGGIAN